MNYVLGRQNQERVGISTIYRRQIIYIITIYIHNNIQILTIDDRREKECHKNPTSYRNSKIRVQKEKV